MADLFDYVSWRGDLDLDRFPFNAADGVVFSQLSYLPMDGIVPGPGEKGSVSVAALARLYTAKRNAGRPDPRDVSVSGAAAVIDAIGAAPRYENCRILGYANRADRAEEKQFSAFCAEIGGRRASKRLLAVFRGTDASLVGWKEDLNMSFLGSVPAQKEAASYLEEAAGRDRLPIIVAGHSKGGNLAIYASAFCPDAVRRRVEAIYSYDAPGFRRGTLQSKGYLDARDRVRSFVPRSSFVGLLLEHGTTPRVVKSSATGLLQHDLCSWEFTRDGPADGGELTALSRLIGDVVREWLAKIGDEQLHRFVEALYKILSAANADSFLDFASDWPQTAIGVIGGLKNVDGPTKKLMGEIVAELFKTAGKNVARGRKKGEGA